MIKMESFSFEFFKFQSYYRRKIRKLSRMEATKGAISCPLTCADELICVVWFGDTSEARRHCDKATFSHVTSSCFRLEMSLPRRCAWFLSWIYFLLLQSQSIIVRSIIVRFLVIFKKNFKNADILDKFGKILFYFLRKNYVICRWDFSFFCWNL
jgi:hypothetical protein